jgi:hypothetical protein
MPKKASSTKKISVSKARTQAASKTTSPSPRVLSVPTYHWYKPNTWQYLSAQIPQQAPLSKARFIMWNVLNQLWTHKRLFGGIVLAFGILNIVLVRGVAGSNDLTNLKSSLDDTFKGVGGEAASSLLGFTYVLASSGSGSTSTSGIYQTILLLICSLAFIWALRQTLAKNQVHVRDSFYRGMYPLVPFVLVIGLLGIQLIPLAVGGGLYTSILNSGIAAHWYEKVLWLVLFLGLALWSLRMITATIFALYIVTLPDIAPLQAYRKARDLVKYRRLLIWRKLIFLPIALLVVSAVIELPLILFITPVAVWSFFVVSMCMLPVVHGYLYNLYRELL